MERKMFCRLGNPPLCYVVGDDEGTVRERFTDAVTVWIDSRAKLDRGCIDMDRSQEITHASNPTIPPR